MKRIIWIQKKILRYSKTRRELTSYYEVDIQELSQSLSRFKDVLENYTRNAYEGIRENRVEETPYTEQSIVGETLKKTEDIKNSTEEDQEDEDSCTKRRVRGTLSF